MAKLLILFFLGIVFSASAKNLSSHVHGLVRLEIAYEKNELLIMLSSPAESFLGFEYKAKTKKELELLTQVKKEWKKTSLSFLERKLSMTAKYQVLIGSKSFQVSVIVIFTQRHTLSVKICSLVEI